MVQLNHPQLKQHMHVTLTSHTCNMHTADKKHV